MIDFEFTFSHVIVVRCDDRMKATNIAIEEMQDAVSNESLRVLFDIEIKDYEEDTEYGIDDVTEAR